MATYKLGCFYGGGGFRGGVQMAHAREYGREADVLGGTSVGALNATMLAAGQYDRLRAIWEEIVNKRDFMRPQLDIWNGAYSLRPTAKLLVSERAVQKYRVPVWAGIIDIGARRSLAVPLHEFSIPERVKLIIGSSTIDPVHEDTAEGPVTPGGPDREIGDGGWTDPLPPIPEAVWRECEEVHAVFCTPRPRVRLPKLPQKKVNGMFERFMANLELALRLANQASWARLRRLRRKYPDTKVTVFHPQNWAGLGDTFQASEELTASRLAIGEAMLRSATVMR